MKIEKTYLQHGVDLEDMSAWEAKNWASEIRHREMAHAPIRKKLLELVKSEYGKESSEYAATDIVVRIAPMFSAIFAAQMESMSKISESWYEKNPQAASELVSEISQLLTEKGYEPYSQYLNLVQEVVYESEPQKLDYISKQLINEGIEHYCAGIPVILSSLGSFKHDQIFSEPNGSYAILEPDIRLLFPHPEKKYEKWVSLLGKKHATLHPDSEAHDFHAALVVWAAGGGWQVISPTSGEALADDWFMVCTNLLKAERWVKAVEKMYGCKVGDNETWEYLLLLYLCHEAGHSETEEGLFEEISTDLPTLLIVLDWEGIDEQKMMRAIAGAYLSEAKEKDHTPDNERGYSLSANHVVNRMLEAQSMADFKRLIGDDWKKLYRKEKEWIEWVSQEELSGAAKAFLKRVKEKLG